MRRRTFLTATCTATALALAGCLSADDADGRDPLTAAGVEVDVDGSEATATIQVAGTGEAEADPDVAVLSVSVEESGDDAESVRSGLAERTTELRDALIGAGVDDDGITTGRYDIRERRRAPGFEGVHTYRAEVDDVDSVGEVIDAAVEGGADGVGRVTFTLSNDRREAVRAEALEEAIGSARSEAEVIASAKGVDLVGVVAVSTTGTDLRPHRGTVVETDDVADEAAAPTEIDEGAVSVSARVEVVYAID
ncbi:SIMPL domain-containing protein [Natronorarus salvus]|uniref:SIMPL domain-containing protein n=1 Tax=Natronorarus salvus TaxID=3117733 RepID=UPI002F25EC7B